MTMYEPAKVRNGQAKTSRARGQFEQRDQVLCPHSLLALLFCKSIDAVEVTRRVHLAESEESKPLLPPSATSRLGLESPVWA